MEAKELAVYFLDNDVTLKLSAYNLFWQCMAAWGVSDAQIRVLPTAKAVFARNRAIYDQYDDRTRQQAAQIAQKSQALPLLAATPDYTRLLAIERIDPGEALLVTAALADPEALILTGDKNFLKAFAQSGLTDLLQRLAGRFVCLEQLMLALIRQDPDFDKIKKRVKNAVPCEWSIAEAFQGRPEPDATTVSQRLLAIVEDLRAATGNLLDRR